MVRPLMDKLVQSHLLPRENDTDHIRNFRSVVSSEIERRFQLKSDDDDTSVVQTSQLACLLDPRYKHLDFEEREMRENIRDALRTEFKKLQEAEKSGDGSGDGTVPPSIAEEFRNPLDFLFNRKTSPEVEFESYLRLSPVDLHTNPLHWWKLNSAQYPVLAKLAKKFLTIPATSASSERVFSSAGNTVTAKRSCLSAEHVDLLISTHQNSRYLR